MIRTDSRPSVDSHSVKSTQYKKPTTAEQGDHQRHENKQSGDGGIDQRKRDEEREGKQAKEDEKQTEGGPLGGCECDPLFQCELPKSTSAARSPDEGSTRSSPGGCAESAIFPYLDP